MALLSLFCEQRWYPDHQAFWEAVRRLDLMILEVFSDLSDSKHSTVKLGWVAVLSGDRSQKCCECEGPFQAGAAGCRTPGTQGMQGLVGTEHLHRSQGCAPHSQALALGWDFYRGMWVWRLLKSQKVQRCWSGCCTSALSLPSLKKTPKICRAQVSWGDFFILFPHSALPLTAPV